MHNNGWLLSYSFLTPINLVYYISHIPELLMCTHFPLSSFFFSLVIYFVAVPHSFSYYEIGIGLDVSSLWSSFKVPGYSWKFYSSMQILPSIGWVLRKTLLGFGSELHWIFRWVLSQLTKTYFISVITIYFSIHSGSLYHLTIPFGIFL